MNNFYKSAFTLIEVLLVILIIGVLSGMVITQLSGRSREAKLTRASSDIRGSFSLAIDLFEHDTGRYPTTDEGLGSLVSDPGVAGWNGPYVKGNLSKDPWGNDYQYSLSSDAPQRYCLSSAGPDGQAGTGDDITFGDIDGGNVP